MEQIQVWTKQHRNTLRILEETGRYIVKKEFVSGTNREDAALFLGLYEWYTQQAAKRYGKPGDVCYPVWVTYRRASVMLQGPDDAILGLTLPKRIVMPVDINKWAMILNYAYIPAGGEDARAHAKLLKEYGVDDAQAVMSRFYPDIRRKVMESWERLFDDSIVMNNADKDGTVWEIRREWVRAVTV